MREYIIAITAASGIFMAIYSATIPSDGMVPTAFVKLGLLTLAINLIAIAIMFVLWGGQITWTSWQLK